MSFWQPRYCEPPPLCLRDCDIPVYLAALALATDTRTDARDGDDPTDATTVSALHRRVVATGFMDVGSVPSPMWLQAAIRHGDTELADDLVARFGGAVLSPSAVTRTTGRGGEWAESRFPYLRSRAPCTQSFAVPGWWPPEGPAALTSQQVTVLVETGDLDALKRALADRRLVLPAGRWLAGTYGWVTCAILALHTDIADWLLKTFGADVVPTDVRYLSHTLHGRRKNAHIEEATAWLDATLARGWKLDGQ